jgi:ankyrin repeat protein
MARKKSSRKQDTTVVPHRTPNLSGFLVRAQYGEAAMLRRFLDAGGSPATLVDVMYGDEHLQLPLLQAVVILNKHPHNQLAESIQLLVQAGANISATSTSRTGEQRAAVWFACGPGCCTKPLRILLQHGASAEPTSNQSVPLQRAAGYGFAEMCEVLIASAESVVNGVDSNNATALLVAAVRGDHAVIDVLCKHGAQLEAQISTGETALHLAAFAGHFAAVNSLIQGGADVNAVNKKGQTVAQGAALSGHLDVVQLLLQHGADRLSLTSAA